MSRGVVVPLLLLLVVGIGDTGGKGGAVVVVGVGGGMDASLALSLSGMRLIFSFLGFFSVGGGGRSSGFGEGLFIVAMVD